MKSEFGWIEIDQVRYDHDVIIHRDGSVTKRSKKKSKELKSTYGHTPLSDQELEVVKKEKPEIVYIGTGQYGDLPITPEAERESAGLKQLYGQPRRSWICSKKNAGRLLRSFM